MKLTVALLENGRHFMVDVPADVDLTKFKIYCEQESGISFEHMIFTHDGGMLHDEELTLEEYGIKDCDCVSVTCDLGGDVDSQASEATSDDAELSAVELDGLLALELDDFQQTRVRELFHSNPAAMRLLWRYNPPLAAKLAANDLTGFTDVLTAQLKLRRWLNEQLRQHQLEAANEEDQLSVDEWSQPDIEQENTENAVQMKPEIFGLVTMLFINCKVNGVPVKAFVDSGAQVTIMSAKCAQRCNVIRLMDIRWRGDVKGVGFSHIMGRIQLAEIEIEQNRLASSITVIEDPTLDMLLGLDMLKRHRCLIDLERNVLRFGSIGTETPFLNESELPRLDDDKAQTQVEYFGDGLSWKSF